MMIRLLFLFSFLFLDPAFAATQDARTDKNEDTGYIQHKFDGVASLRVAPAANVALNQPCKNTSAPSGDKSGALRYNSAINNIEYCDGTTWNVLGAMKAAACTAATKGALRYDDAVELMKYCDGSIWRIVGVPASTGGCNAMARGSARYNSTAEKMQYCDGSAWVNFGSTIPLGVNYAGCGYGKRDVGTGVNNWHHFHYTSASDRAPDNDHNTNIACPDKMDGVVSMENGHIDQILCCTVGLQ